MAFPLAHAANERTLVDRQGTPFPILGRAAWFLVSRSQGEQLAFIDDSLRRGHNAIEIAAPGHDPRGNRAPRDGDGDLPFRRRLDGAVWRGALDYDDIGAEAPDFSTPNEPYWTFVDALLAACESRGILVFLFPAYVGYQGGKEGWLREMAANGAPRMRAYGAFVAARYRDRKNIVWMAGGDMGTGADAFDPAQSEAERGLLDGLRSVAGRASVEMSAEWASESIATDEPAFGSLMTLNGVYSWSGNVTSLGIRAYARAPALPAFLLEQPYDEEGPDGNRVNRHASQPVRRFQWWGWLTTIGGAFSGNGYVWPFVDPEWTSHLDSQGSRDVARLNAFVRSIPWWELVPSGMNGMKSLVTAGGGAPEDPGFVAAVASPAGTLLVAYVPPAHTGDVTVDLSALGAPVRARWFNPATAAYTAAGSYPNTAPRSFTPPGDNGTGFRDWVLVLDTQ